MPKTREQKKKIIEQLKENIAKQKAMVFVAINGLEAKDLFDLRKRLKKADCLLQVVKKTMLKIAFEQSKIKIEACPVLGGGAKLQGQMALIFGFGDEIAPAKTSYNFSRENENLKILAGFFENEFRQAEQIVALAQIPSKEELLAKVVSSIFAPVSNFINILQAPLEACILIIKSLGVNKIEK